MPDRLHPVEWLTYGSDYITGLKPGDMPLVDFTRDCLHREKQRTSGAYKQNTLYSATGQLLSHTFSDPMLNREYGFNDNGQLVHIRGVHQEEDYRCEQQGAALLESRYLYDPLGRRVSKRVWKNRRTYGEITGNEYIQLFPRKLPGPAGTANG